MCARLVSNSMHVLSPLFLVTVYTELFALASNANITGPIPATLGNLNNMVTLILNNNRLSGAIPPELGGMVALERLALQRNLLTSTIPPELGGLVSLTIFTLGRNSITGEMPAEICSLTPTLAELVPDCTVNCTCCSACI